MLQCRNVTFKYPKGKLMSFPDISCPSESHWLILGQSGSGKTTLLHLLAGLMPPLNGEITIRETRIDQLSKTRLDHFRGRQIGLVLQQPHLIRSLTIKQNLRAATYFAKNKLQHNRIDEILEEVGIGNKSHLYPHQLSQGERQRAGIARAVINQPKLILADEPTSALDDVNTEKVLQLLIKEAHQVGAILMVVTHDNRLKAHFDHIIRLS